MKSNVRNLILVTALVLGPLAAAAAGSEELLLTAATPAESLAIDIAGGTLLVAGAELDEKSSCGPRASAYVARQDRAGQDIWRRRAVELIGPAAADPAGHVLASAIRDLEVDPISGHLYVVGDLLLGWRENATPDTVSTARGTFTLLLAEDGTVLARRFLGVRPRGGPVGVFSCDELRAPEERPSFGAVAVALDPSGEVVMVGVSSDPGRPPHRFERRLPRDLSKPVRATTPLPKLACLPLDPHNVLSAIPTTPYDQIHGTKADLALDDGCALKIMPHDHSDTVGLEVTLGPKSPVQQPFARFEIHLHHQGGPVELDVAIKDSSGVFTRVNSYSSKEEDGGMGNGRIQEAFSVSRSPFVQADGSFVLRLTSRSLDGADPVSPEPCEDHDYGLVSGP